MTGCRKKKEGKGPVEQSFETTIKIEREEPPLVPCSEGAFSGENLDSALEACNAAAEEEPENGTARYYRGFVLYHKERYLEAEQDFTAAIEFGSSRLAESYYQRGACKERQRRLREAASDFKKANELKPEWSAARRKVDEYQWAF